MSSIYSGLLLQCEKKRLHPFINHCKTSLQNFLLAQEKVGASGERGNRVQIVFLRCSSISLTILFPQSYTNFHSPSQIYIYMQSSSITSAAWPTSPHLDSSSCLLPRRSVNVASLIETCSITSFCLRSFSPHSIA